MKLLIAFVVCMALGTNALDFSIDNVEFRSSGDDLSKFQLNDALQNAPLSTAMERMLEQSLAKLEKQLPSARGQLSSINDFVEMVISEVRYLLVQFGFDPIVIPPIDATIPIEDKEVRIVLENGVISSTSSMFRDGDVNITYNERVLRIFVPIFFKELKMVYDYDIVVDGASLNGKVNGEVVLVEVNFSVKVDFLKLRIELEKFVIPRIGAINVKWEGGMINWILQGITDYITGQLKEEVILVVQGVCAFTLETIFDILNQVFAGIKP